MKKVIMLEENTIDFIIFFVVASGIIVGFIIVMIRKFLVYKNYDDYIMNYFPYMLITVLLLIPIIMQEYLATLISIIIIGFVLIVVNSRKYPSVNKFIDTLF